MTMPPGDQHGGETPTSSRGPSPYAAPPPRPMVLPQRSSALPIILIILVVLLVGFCAVSMLVGGSLGSLSGGGLAAMEGQLVETFVAGDRDAEDLAVIVPITGVIGAPADGLLGATRDPLELARRRMEEAARRGAKAVILEVDSPGGGVWASAWLHRQISDLKREHGIKVVAQMKTVAASGGYYVSAPADWIIAAPSTLTGSIGVILAHYDATELVTGKAGVRYQPFTSAPQKDILSPLRPMREDERTHVQSMVDGMYAEFVKVVLEGRGPRTTREQVLGLESTVITGTQALEAGLVDQLGYRDEVVAKVKELTGTSLRIVRFDPPAGLFDSLLGAKTPARIEVDLGLPESAKALPPGMQYLWTGGL